MSLRFHIKTNIQEAIINHTMNSQILVDIKMIIKELKGRDNTEIYIMNEPGDWTGMFWRFSAAADKSVDVMLSRDTDSRLTLREKESQPR